MHCVSEIVGKFTKFQTRSSRWVFNQVIRLDIQSDRLNPLRVGTWIRMPSFISRY